MLIEQDVQIGLILRAVLYGTACMTYFTVIQYFTQSASLPGASTWQIILSLTDEAIYWIPGFFMLGPLMVYDMLKITNRVAGPIFALRRQMTCLYQQQPGRSLAFRNDDYWDSLAAEFNQVREELLQLRSENEELRAAATNVSSAHEADAMTRAGSSIDAVVPR